MLQGYIGMSHKNVRPDDPAFDKRLGMQDIIEWARKDLLALTNCGIDTVTFSNEFSRPFLTRQAQK
jgi:hypothetical protein